VDFVRDTNGVLSKRGLFKKTWRQHFHPGGKRELPRGKLHSRIQSMKIYRLENKERKLSTVAKEDAN